MFEKILIFQLREMYYKVLVSLLIKKLVMEQIEVH